MMLKFADVIKALNETLAEAAKNMGSGMNVTVTSGSGAKSGSGSTVPPSGSGSGSGATVSVSVSGLSGLSGLLGSGSGSAAAKPEKLQKLDKQLNIAKDVLHLKGLKAIADVVGPSVAMIRGAMCVICQDPEAPIADLWADGKPVINTAVVTEVTTALAASLNTLREMAKDCVAMAKGVIASTEAITGTKCAAAQTLLTSLEKDASPCADAAACGTASTGAVTTAFNVNGVDIMTGDAPADSSFRRNLASTFTSSATGGANAQPDAEEDK